MRYKPERALTLQTIAFPIWEGFYCVEMRYKPERALTPLITEVFHRARPGVEMRYKPERALTLSIPRALKITLL